jgi:hypothetical protein
MPRVSQVPRVPCTALACVIASSLVSAALSAAVVLAMLPAAVRAQAERMQAPAYVLVGPDGSDRGALETSTTPQGQIVSSLRLNQDGALRARMETGRNSPDAAALTLRDRKEQVRLRLALAASLVPGQAGDLTSVDVLDQDQHVRVHIGTDGAGAPFLQLLDADGQVVWSAP